MAFENAEQIVKLAEQLDLTANTARKRLNDLIDANKIKSDEARRAARKIAAIREDAVDLTFGAIHLIIDGLDLTQTKLMRVIKDARKKIEKIRKAAMFMDLLSDLVIFSAAASAGNPGMILASLNEVRKDLS